MKKLSIATAGLAGIVLLFSSNAFAVYHGRDTNAIPQGGSGVKQEQGTVNGSGAVQHPQGSDPQAPNGYYNPPL